eukprot:TRINITY_DN7165_c0_g1_i3.p1 TRINITY_DN7165_c0_g1~~TRINITY_DN7165_c0_g1_i3.p1  ORF type:complete len:136 (+),score=19.87 TRINITY_DN7165_c0_g1_i3:64-471(+)
MCIRDSYMKTHANVFELLSKNRFALDTDLILICNIESGKDCKQRPAALDDKLREVLEHTIREDYIKGFIVEELSHLKIPRIASLFEKVVSSTHNHSVVHDLTKKLEEKTKSKIISESDFKECISRLLFSRARILS